MLPGESPAGDTTVTSPDRDFRSNAGREELCHGQAADAAEVAHFQRGEF